MNSFLKYVIAKNQTDYKKNEKQVVETIAETIKENRIQCIDKK